MTIQKTHYIYGIVLDNNKVSPDTLLTGIGGAPVHFMRSHGLAALASYIAPGTVAQTRRNMIAHTAVLERAIMQTTVLPVRFATVAPDEASLMACLEAHASAFQKALADIDGKIELGVKASWHSGLIFEDIMTKDNDLKRLRDRLRSRPSNETFYERVELGRRVEGTLAERRKETADFILAGLLKLAVRDTELRILDDDMIFNRAFLVARSNEAAFDAHMDKLAIDREGQINFKYIGPVPPYNFTNLQAGWMAGKS